MRRAETGFTLIEVLVALVVTSLLLAVVLEAATGALSRLHRTTQARTALLYGRYLLLRGQALDYGGGNGAGRAGNLAWVSREELVARDPRGFSGLMRVQVTVADIGGHRLFDRAILKLKTLPQR